MKQNSQIKGMCMVSMAMILATSCSKDAAYDDLFESDAIDMNMEIAAGGLTLPFGSTEQIKLTELIDPDDSESIDIDANGNYYLAKSGSFDPTKFKVNPVQIKANPTISPVNITLDAYAIPAEVTALLDVAASLGFQVEGKTLEEINNAVKNSSNPVVSAMALKGNIDIKAKADDVDFGRETPFNINASNVDNQLISLTRITPDGDVDIQLDIEVVNLPGKQSSYSIELNEVKISLPAYMEIYDMAGMKLDPTNIDAKLTATKAAGQERAVANLHYVVKNFDFASDPLVNNGGSLSRESTIAISGKADVTEFNIELSELKVVKEGNGWKVQINKEVSFRPTVKPIEVNIKKINGRFNPTINDITTTVNVNLGDDIDFLQKEDAVIDIKNPEIKIDINYNAKIRVLADMILSVPQQGTQVIFSDVVIEDADGDGKQTIYLNRERREEGKYYANDALSTLFSPVPDQIDVRIVAHADQANNYELELGNQYNVSGEYDVNVPFDFKKIAFTYDEESNDLFGEDEDISDYLKNLDGVTADLVIESTLPLDVNLDIVGRDKNGHERSVLKGSSPVIKAGQLGAPVESAFSLELNIDTQVDKDLIYRFKANGEGEFNANQYLQLKSSKLTIKKQQVDLNDM